MKRRHILFLAGLSVLIVTLFVMGWEFAFEDIVDSWLAGEPENETSHDRWEYVITATAAASMAWIALRQMWGNPGSRSMVSLSLASTRLTS